MPRVTPLTFRYDAHSIYTPRNLWKSARALPLLNIHFLISNFRTTIREINCLVFGISSSPEIDAGAIYTCVRTCVRACREIDGNRGGSIGKYRAASDTFFSIGLSLLHRYGAHKICYMKCYDNEICTR